MILQSKDFCRYFLDTFCYYKGDLCYISSYDGTKNEFTVTSLDGFQQKTFPYAVRYEDFEPFFPAAGFYNQKSAFYLHRKPARQYKKSFCRSLYTAVSFDNLIGFPRRDFVADLATIFNPVYPSIEGALKVLEKTRSIAVNKDFVFARSVIEKSKSASVYCLTEYVAEVPFYKYVVKVKSPVFKQELDDLFRGSAFHVQP